jgi:hypothetical protein
MRYGLLVKKVDNARRMQLFTIIFSMVTKKKTSVVVELVFNLILSKKKRFHSSFHYTFFSIWPYFLQYPSAFRDDFDDKALN